MTGETCLPRELLKQYLNGAIDADQTSSIEDHLANCTACEQTVVQLESDPDTLLATVRELGNLTNQANSIWSDSPSVIKHAVATARRLPGPVTAASGPFGKPDPIRGQIGAYQLLKLLGQGGMGQVYLARHVSLDKQVAIKLLFPRTPQSSHFDFVGRFQREMRAAGRLNHPSIISATDAGEMDGIHYLVMEYIDGLDLSRIAQGAGSAKSVHPLEIADACELMRQTALGLSHAHAHGIVHRDIKPSNLMLDARGQVKILDFGLAQWNMWDESTRDITTVGQLMGTLDYMAPEQAERTEGVDYRADLYALGATLFRLLTGRAPLAASPNMTLLEKVRLLGSQSAPSLSALRADAPRELVALVGSLLSRAPAERPASAAHVAEALEPFCVGHQLEALFEQARSRVERAPADSDSVYASHPTLPQAADAMQPPPRSLHRWLWGAAMLPLMVLAGVLLTLELQKGQLVIQSDVANVKVKLVRDGNFVEQLTIQPGAQATRLRADQYEIVIESPSDEVTIDKEQFTLRQGATVVAVIKQLPQGKVQPAPSLPSPSMQNQSLPNNMAADVPATGNNATGSNPITNNTTANRSITPGDWAQRTAAGTSPDANLPGNRMQSRGNTDPRDDRNLAGVLPTNANGIPTHAEVSSYLKVLEVTKLDNAKLIALSTLASILEVEDGPKAISRLLAEAGKWRDHSAIFDDGLLCCLAKCTEEEEFINLVDSMLLAGEQVWRVRWLSAMAQMGKRQMQFNFQFNHSDKLLEYFASERFAQGRLKSFAPSDNELWMEFVRKKLAGSRRLAQAYASYFIDLALQQPGMGRMSALRWNLEPGNVEFGDRLNGSAAELEEPLDALALAVLKDDKAQPEEYAHAAYRLASTNWNFLIADDATRKEIATSLKDRLNQLNQSQATRIFGHLPMRPGVPKDWRPVRTRQGELWPGTRPYDDVLAANASRYTNSETLAYLALVKRLNLTSSLDAELTQLLDRCIEAEKPLRDAIGTHNEWPPSVGGNPSQEKLDALVAPWKDIPVHSWTAQLVHQALRDLSATDLRNDSQLAQRLLTDDALWELLMHDRDHDQKLSLEEARPALGASSNADRNGDGSIDLEELLALRREALQRLPAKTSSKPAAKDKPAIFEGRTLEEWLEIFQRDKSYQTRVSALNAISMLTTPASANEVTDKLIEIARKQSGAAATSEADSFLKHLYERNFVLIPYMSIDLALVQCLRKINDPPAFEKLMLGRLLEGEDPWTARWWQQLLYLYPLAATRTTEKLPISIADTFLWLDPDRSTRLGEKSLPIAMVYMTMLMQQDEALARERFPLFAKRVAEDPRLGKAFLLRDHGRLGWRVNQRIDANLAPPGEKFMEETTAALAKEWLQADNVDAEVHARAAGWLSTTTNIVDTWRDELLVALRKRWQALAKDTESKWQILSSIGVHTSDPLPSAYNLFQGKEAEKKTWHFRRRYINHEMLAYVALIKRLKATAEFKEELTAIADATRDGWEETQKALSQGNLQTKLPSWPYSAADIATADPLCANVQTKSWLSAFIYREVYGLLELTK